MGGPSAFWKDHAGSMTAQLRVLLVHHSAEAAEHLLLLLQGGGYEPV